MKRLVMADCAHNFLSNWIPGLPDSYTAYWWRIPTLRRTLVPPC